MLNFTKPVHYKARVIEKTQLTSKVFWARYQLIKPPTLTFVAGQTIMITVAPNIYRPMSIASPPQENTVITSIQDVSPDGPGSKWMEALKVRDTLEFMAPLGRFVIDRESPRKRVLVATGTGIAPFRSMLLDCLDGLACKKAMSLYWGLRFAEDVYLQDELKQLIKDYTNLSYYLILSKPPEDWTGLKGHVTEFVFTNEKDPKNCDFYLCGNKAMITEIQKKLAEKGVSAEQTKFDPFY